jgi:hypothetical protein
MSSSFMTSSRSAIVASTISRTWKDPFLIVTSSRLNRFVSLNPSRVAGDHPPSLPLCGSRRSDAVIFMRPGSCSSCRPDQFLPYFPPTSLMTWPMSEMFYPFCFLFVYSFFCTMSFWLILVVAIGLVEPLRWMSGVFCIDLLDLSSVSLYVLAFPVFSIV